MRASRIVRDAVQPVGGRVFEALASPVSSVPGSVVPRLGSAFWSMTAPVVRAILCRHGPGQMRADADEAAQRLAAVNRCFMPIV